MESAHNMLNEIVNSEASGELVAAARDVEVHVYFQDGRLAWATSSAAPQAFLRHLVETHGADRDALREVIEECRRSRKKFGQTLVDWGVATSAQVRDALRFQITGALSTLCEIPRDQALFLPKTLAYSDDFTFDLSEVMPSVEADPPSPERAADGRRPELLDRYLQACTDVAWAAVVPPGQVDGPAVADREAVAELLSRLIDVAQTAEVITVRSISGAVIGRRAGAEWLFGGVPAGVGFALPAAVMAHVIGSRERSRTNTEAPTARVRPLPEAGAISSVDALVRTVETTDEVVAALIIGSDVVAGAIQDGLNDDLIFAAARRLSAALPLSLTTCLPSSDSVVSSLQYEKLAIHACDQGVDLFGASLSARPDLSFWLVLSGCNSAGMGWALLAALARQAEELMVRT